MTKNELSSRLSDLDIFIGDIGSVLGDLENGDRLEVIMQDETRSFLHYTYTSVHSTFWMLRRFLYLQLEKLD